MNYSVNVTSNALEISLARTGGQGAKGDIGLQGPTGKSAYQLAVENGYTYSEAQYLIDLNTAINASSSAASSASTATTKAAEAATSAATASTRATEAATSASTATTKAAEATSSAATASTKAGEAAVSAAAALVSENTAAGSASSATTQANNSASSASTAATQAGVATAQATNAANSATAASTSASTASTQASNAGTSATNSAASATAAATSATNAAGSATTATTKAAEAANSATTASTKATEAANSATTASTKATEAASSATNSSSSATSSNSSAVLASEWASKIGSTVDGSGYSAKHWALAAASNPVLTVAGRTGDVVVTKSDVGLASVDNTSDLSKPVSTATQTALDSRAPLASPTLTGVPLAPTAAAGTNTTQIATTAHVVAERSASRALTNLTGITVVSGGASISGNVSVTGQVTTTDNVGVGVTPSAWGTGTSQRAIQLPATAIYSYSDSRGEFLTNSYFNGTNYIYRVNYAALKYVQEVSSGDHSWYTAPSGTAGNTITFNQAMTLDASGNLLVGTTSASWSSAGRGLIEVNGGSTALIGLKTGGTQRTYFYHTGGGTFLDSLTGGITLQTTGGTAQLDTSGNLLPGANGTQAFGSTSLRWSQVWCTAGAFNTSDATLKTPIRTMQEKELAAGYQMAQELGTFQWLDSVKEKGDKARRHVGLTVQRAAEIMESHGLKPWSYGFMGYDKWEAVTEVVDATEDDDGAYQEQVTRQKTEKQASQKQTVEIVNGKPTLKVEAIETDTPVTEQIQVVNADGNPVFIDVPEVPAVLDEEGHVVTPAVHAHQVPMLHAVPVMETVKVWKRAKEVRPAGESYAFRSDQLAFFIAAGVAAKARA